jgi:hypothetical protein
MVYAQRETRYHDLLSEAHTGFEGLRKEMVSFLKTVNDQNEGQMGLYVVFTEDNLYVPEYILQRNMIVSPSATIPRLYRPPLK